MRTRSCKLLKTRPYNVQPTIQRHCQRHQSTSSSSPRLTLSAIDGSTHPPLAQSTLPAYWNDTILRHHADRPALICRSEKPRPHGGPQTRNLGVESHLAWSFGEMDEQVGALARGLIGLGVKKGDRVGVIMGNNSAYAMLQWACARIGAILVTLNPAYRLPELVNTLSLVGVSHLFVVPRVRSSSYINMFADAFPSLVNSSPGSIQEPALPHLKHLVVTDNTPSYKEFQTHLDMTKCTVDFREVLVWGGHASEEKVVRETEAGLKTDEVINLQFTSGTTGSPKAVSLTHHNLLNNGIQIGRCMRLTDQDVLCNVPPLFHCFGLVLGNLAAWTHGASIVYPSDIFDPPKIVDAVLQEKCTALHGVPTHFLGVLKEVERRHVEGERLDFSMLRTGIASGSSIPIALMKKLIDKLNLTELTIAYGMTETSPVTFQTTPKDPILKRVETVGKIHPHTKAKIVDGAGEVVPVGTPGELLISGYNLQKGYWEDPEQTAAAMKRDEDGVLWMHTGDEGIMDEEGYLKIVGRIKDIIIRGGENLFPVQIENILTSHPAILEAAIVAVPDETYGEVVGAWIIRDPSVRGGGGERMVGMKGEEVRKVVANGMNPQNAPKWVWFVGEEGYDELPKTASGKVQKHILRQWSKDLARRNIGLVE
ncbi:acyl-CoA synthetase [Irpex rosettiformis]|uniref:Acyl-CoA synthetase n=1 Tax=Irpex rosettiformis TaxID=378272 RepID=A0ACB8TWN9_9APHY|nr:acyl-CoA synthetase [Irpex rosettiformis]